MSMSDRDGFIWYDGKLVPWREATTHVLTLPPLRTVRLRRRARLRNRGRHRHLPAAGPHQPPVQIRPTSTRSRCRTTATPSTRPSAKWCAPTAWHRVTCARWPSMARKNGVSPKGRPGARGHRRLALGRLSGRDRPGAGHPRQGVLVRAPARQRHHAARQGGHHVRQFHHRQCRSAAGWLRRGPAARYRGFRGRRRRREHFHRQGRRAVRARDRLGADGHHPLHHPCAGRRPRPARRHQAPHTR